MTYDGFKRIGKSLNPSYSEEQAISEGIKNFVLDLDSLKTMFEKNKTLRENTIIVVSNSRNDGASGLQKHYELFESKDSALFAYRKTIYQFSDAVFSANKNDIDFFLGEKEGYTKDDIISNFGKLMPCIHGSDAHTEAKLFEPDNNRYCWIKAEPSFEGLKQIIYEPKERVRIQEIKPEEKPPYQVIESITLNHDDFKNQTIYFNQNLNTIIGGRSSGKSILLGCVAKKIDETRIIKDSENYDSYIQEICEKIEIKWKDNQDDGSHRKIEYFGQSVINGYAAEPNEINKIIERIIRREEEKNNAITRYDLFLTDNQKNITNKIAEFIDYRNKIITLNEKIKEIGNRKGIESEIDKIKLELEQIRNSQKESFSENQLNEYQKLVEKREEINAELTTLTSDNLHIFALKDKQLLIPIAQNTSSLSTALRDKITIFYSELEQEVQKKWIDFINSIETENWRRDEEDRASIRKIDDSDLYKQGKEYFSKNETYTNKTNTLKEEQDKLRDIVALEEEKKEIKKHFDQCKNEILSLHCKYYGEVKQLAENLSVQKDDVEIVADVQSSGETFTERFSEVFNKSTGEGKNQLDYNFTDIDNHKNKMKEILEKLDDEKILVMRSGLQFALNRIFSENFISIAYKIKYDGDDFNLMSEGKKAFIILRLLLDFDESSKCPILIDQPEDDLDNRAIYTDLVEYLRKKKKQRQIILVTHNPNVVVGADSELVIVANQNGIKNNNPNDTKFWYYADSLEHSFTDKEESMVLYKQGIREHVCEILEGGDVAFKLREQKYGYNKN